MIFFEMKKLQEKCLFLIGMLCLVFCVVSSESLHLCMLSLFLEFFPLPWFISVYVVAYFHCLAASWKGVYDLDPINLFANIAFDAFIFYWLFYVCGFYFIMMIISSFPLIVLIVTTVFVSNKPFKSPIYFAL